MKAETKANKSANTEKIVIAPILSEGELAALGDGHIAYVKEMTSDQAIEMFPSVDDLPRGLSLYALHAADGTPIALTDTLQAAIGHAIEDELEVRALH